MKSLTNLINALKGEGECNCANGVAIGKPGSSANPSAKGGWNGRVTIS
jgi:hypothetical protein